MSRLEWVPWDLFGTTIAVSSLELEQSPALNPTQFTGPVVEGFIEPYDNYKVHRIVGQVVVATLAPASANEPAFVIITPGLIDSQLGVVQTAFGSGTGIAFPQGYDAAVANAELWYVRGYTPASGPANPFGTLSQFAHPWFTQVDIQPKRRLDINEVPTLCVVNTDANEDMIFRQHLRMLVSRA